MVPVKPATGRGLRGWPFLLCKAISDRLGEVLFSGSFGESAYSGGYDRFILLLLTTFTMGFQTVLSADHGGDFRVKVTSLGWLFRKFTIRE